MHLIRTTAAGHATDLAMAEVAYRPVDPQLAQFVHGYFGYRLGGSRNRRINLIPNGFVTVLLDLEVTGAGVVIGLCDETFTLDGRIGRMVIAVALTPLGAYAVLGGPMSQLANTSVDLRSAGFSRQEVTRVLDAEDWLGRFEELNSLFAHRIATGGRTVHAVDAAWQRMNDSNGNITIDTLASEIGWSRRYLVTLFLEQVGLSPKRVARVLRFRRAVSLLGEPTALRLTDIARLCGYGDQPHLNREFQALCGRTPTELRRIVSPVD